MILLGTSSGVVAGCISMAEYYKFEIANWNEGTQNLTLEQEAAYLRVVNAIRLHDQPITFNKFALCGMWRCNERKAKRLLDELIEAGKLRLSDGKIINDKAVDDASTLSRLRSDRSSAGRRGGIESGKSRSKHMKSNDTGEAIASTREEKRREYSSSAGAREPKSDQDPTHRERLLDAIGADRSGCIGPNGTVLGTVAHMEHAKRWSEMGLSVDRQCAVIREVIQRKQDKDPFFVPRSFGYFDGPMQEAAQAASGQGRAGRSVDDAQTAFLRRVAGGNGG